MTPCSLVEVYRVFGDAYCLHLQSKRVKEAKARFSHVARSVCFFLVACLTYSPTLKMEAVCFSETLVNFYQPTRRYILVTAVRT
jgi:hypothetical protein